MIKTPDLTLNNLCILFFGIVVEIERGLSPLFLEHWYKIKKESRISF